MSITFSELFSKFREYKIQLVCANRINAPIYYAGPLDENKHEFDSNCLYIGRASQIKNLVSHPVPLNILCYSRNAVPPAIPEGTECNMIFLETEDDSPTLLANVREFFSQEERYADFSMRLLDALDKRKGLKEILNIGYEYIGNPMLINDSSFSLIESTNNDDIDDPFWIDIINNKYVSPDIVETFKTDHLYERILKSREPILGVWDKAKYKRLLSNISVGNKIVAQLFVLEFEREFSEEHLKLITLLSNVISWTLQRDTPFAIAKQTLYEHFLIDLLSGKLKDPSVIEERSHMLELHLSDKIYVIVMDLSHFDQIGITMASSISVLENMIADGKVLIYQNHIVVIVSQAEKASVDMKLTDLETFLMNKPIIVGISRKFKHLDEIQKHYNQAVRALELGCILNNGKQIIQYDDIAIFHMFEIYSKNELRDFCHPAVIALMEFDIKHKSCYTQTLFSYITMAQKKLGSANSLHVHRNTVNYRIQKIQEITGMDLADNNFFQDCYLSMKILEYTRDIQIVNDQCIINYGQDLSESKR